MTESSDHQLAPARWTAWYSEHAQRLKAFLTSMLRNRDWAEEALQRTFAKALTHGGGVAAGSEQAWLFQVAYREALGLRKQHAVDGRAKVAWSELHPARHAEAVDGELIQWEQVRDVQQALEQLPAEQRDVVRRRIYEDETFQKIADELRIPLGTVLTRMRLALQRLRQILKSPS